MGLPIATVNIVLRTSSVTRAGFGTPIFIAQHSNYLERVRTYQNITSVAEDFLTTDSAYIAAAQFFANTPRPARIKIGRRASTLTLTPSNTVEDNVYSFELTTHASVLDDSENPIITVTFTAGETPTAQSIATGLMTAAQAIDELDALTFADGGAVLTVSGPAFVFGTVVNLTSAFSTLESAPAALLAIREEDDDFYFVTSDDHTSTFVIAMSTAVQATEKLYFVSTQEAGSLATYNVNVTDVLGALRTNSPSRTTGMWSQVADTTYPECNYVAHNAPYAADVRSVVWDGRILANVPLAINSNGNAITSTQQLNLNARNASYIVNTSLGARILGGKMANGTWIDEQVIVDTMTARVREGQEQLILNQQGSKLPGGQEGISLCAAALASSLNPFIAAKSIVSYTIFTDAATIDQQTRTLSGMEFNAELTGAILRIVINGDLENQEV